MCCMLAKLTGFRIAQEPAAEEEEQVKEEATPAAVK